MITTKLPMAAESGFRDIHHRSTGGRLPADQVVQRGRRSRSHYAAPAWALFEGLRRPRPRCYWRAACLQTVFWFYLWKMFIKYRHRSALSAPVWGDAFGEAPYNFSPFSRVIQQSQSFQPCIYIIDKDNSAATVICSKVKAGWYFVLALYVAKIIHIIFNSGHACSSKMPSLQRFVVVMLYR